jgi:hypothetical protein
MTLEVACWAGYSSFVFFMYFAWAPYHPTYRLSSVQYQLHVLHATYQIRKIVA